MVSTENQWNWNRIKTDQSPTRQRRSTITTGSSLNPSIIGSDLSPSHIQLRHATTAGNLINSDPSPICLQSHHATTISNMEGLLNNNGYINGIQPMDMSKDSSQRILNMSHEEALRLEEEAILKSFDSSPQRRRSTEPGIRGLQVPNLFGNAPNLLGKASVSSSNVPTSPPIESAAPNITPDQIQNIVNPGQHRGQSSVQGAEINDIRQKELRGQSSVYGTEISDTRQKERIESGRQGSSMEDIPPLSNQTEPKDERDSNRSNPNRRRTTLSSNPKNILGPVDNRGNRRYTTMDGVKGMSAIDTHELSKKLPAAYQQRQSIDLADVLSVNEKYKKDQAKKDWSSISSSSYSYSGGISSSSSSSSQSSPERSQRSRNDKKNYKKSPASQVSKISRSSKASKESRKRNEQQEEFHGLDLSSDSGAEDPKTLRNNYLPDGSMNVSRSPFNAYSQRVRSPLRTRSQSPDHNQVLEKLRSPERNRRGRDESPIQKSSDSPARHPIFKRHSTPRADELSDFDRKQHIVFLSALQVLKPHELQSLLTPLQKRALIDSVARPPSRPFRVEPNQHIPLGPTRTHFVRQPSTTVGRVHEKLAQWRSLFDK